MVADSELDVDSDLTAELAAVPRRAEAAAAEIKALIALADRLLEAGYPGAGALSSDLSIGQRFDPDYYVQTVTETAEAVATVAGTRVRRGLSVKSKASDKVK